MKVIIRRKGPLRGGPGVKVHTSDGNTMIKARPGAGGGGGTLPVPIYEDASIRIDIDGNGVRLLNKSTGEYAKMFPTGTFGVVHSTDYQALLNAGPSGGFFLQNYNKSLDIVSGAITQNMSIREVDVCDGGVAKKMLVIASAPY